MDTELQKVTDPVDPNPNPKTSNSSGELNHDILIMGIVDDDISPYCTPCLGLPSPDWLNPIGLIDCKRVPFPPYI